MFAHLAHPCFIHRKLWEEVRHTYLAQCSGALKSSRCYFSTKTTSLGRSPSYIFSTFSGALKSSRCYFSTKTTSLHEKEIKARSLQCTNPTGLSPTVKIRKFAKYWLKTLDKSVCPLGLVVLPSVFLNSTTNFDLSIGWIVDRPVQLSK